MVCWLFAAHQGRFSPDCALNCRGFGGKSRLCLTRGAGVGGSVYLRGSYTQFWLPAYNLVFSGFGRDIIVLYKCPKSWRDGVARQAGLLPTDLRSVVGYVLSAWREHSVAHIFQVQKIVQQFLQPASQHRPLHGANVLEPPHDVASWQSVAEVAMHTPSTAVHRPPKTQSAVGAAQSAPAALQANAPSKWQ